MSVAAGRVEIVICSDAAALAADAADRIVAAAHTAIAQRGRFTLVLSGGSTPERTYRLLAQNPRRQQIDWTHTWLFFGDERCVPHDDPRSNYHLAAESLLKPAQIEATHVLSLPTGFGSPAQTASAYESTLRKFFNGSSSRSADGVPQFDLILLGLGDDGHTASLFPGKPTLDEKQAWVTHSPPGVLPPPVDRVTFTFPVINAAQQVMFLVSGAGKASIVQEVLEGPPDVHKHPACGVQPIPGKLTWLLDEPAAKLLTPKPIEH
ncbi:MAG TPA: 6-phosphogluconolactonase [Pirellulales bacterium]|nr:6-phosphogluconolactonase [Pirellulales bacterium]